MSTWGSERVKKYYQENPHKLEERKAKEKKRYYRRMHWIAWYKVKKGCEFCGYNSQAVALQFDHRDPHTKEFHITTRLMHNLKKLFNEIRKCRILCANCHAIHTHG